jgi:asparagine synthase (glutamine-hydrolysing)
MLVGTRGNLTVSADGTDILYVLIARLDAAGFLREWRGFRGRGRSGMGLLYNTLAPLLPPRFLRLLMTRLGRGDSTLDGLRRDIPQGKARRLTRRENLARLCRRGQDWGTCHSLAAWDIDLRDPTSAKPVIEYCYAIPPEQFCFRGESRRLMRRLLTGMLPPEVLDLKKRGLQAASWREMAANSRDQVRAETERLALGAELSRVLDYERLRELAHEPVERITRERYQTLLAAILADRFVRGERADLEVQAVSSC